MSTNQTAVAEHFTKYIQSISLREPDFLKRLRDETSRLPEGRMQISPEQGQFMQVLIRTLSAKLTLEVGVFTGYSSISVALALPVDLPGEFDLRIIEVGQPHVGPGQSEQL